MPASVNVKQTPQSSESHPIDKDYLYGRYQRPIDERVAINNERLRWENKLGRQVAHKALDEPMLDEEDMGINVDNRREIHTTGLGFKELALIGAMMLGTGGLGAVGMALVQRMTVQQPQLQPATGGNSDTVIVPKISFGPDK